MTDTEYEIKSAIQPQQVARLVDGFEWKSTTEVSDQYFDTESRELFLAGVFVRLRNGRRLDIKYNANLTDISHSHCSDTGYDYPLDDVSLNEIQTFIGEFINADLTSNLLGSVLRPFVKITKLRKDYRATGLTISVDEVTGLGLFAEVEAESPKYVTAMNDLFRENALTNLPIGYVELYLRLHEYPLYIRGRYVLSSDKINQ